MQACMRVYIRNIHNVNTYSTYTKASTVVFHVNPVLEADGHGFKSCRADSRHSVLTISKLHHVSKSYDLSFRVPDSVGLILTLLGTCQHSFWIVSKVPKIFGASPRRCAISAGAGLIKDRWFRSQCVPYTWKWSYSLFGWKISTACDAAFVFPAPRQHLL